VSVSIEITGLDPLIAKLERLARPDQVELMEQIGSLVESQTRNRIANEKRDPSGKQWKKWSAKYARTRHGGHSLLMNEGDLLDSIQWQVSGDKVEIGSNLVYARTHQLGRGAIPARPYLGLSDENRDEISEVIDEWLVSL
jgi:phage virion morphogenesis protein